MILSINKLICSFYLRKGLLPVLLLLFSVIRGNAQINQALTATASHSSGGATPYTATNYNDNVIAKAGSLPWGWITASNTSGTNAWIQFDWGTTVVPFNEVKFYNVLATTRVITGGEIQAWNGTTWVKVHTFTVAADTEVSVKFPTTAATKMRITNFTMIGTNPNFREIQVKYKPAFPNDVGVASIDSPYAFCSGRFNVISTIQNFGSNKIDSINVHWSVNGTVQTPVLYTGGLDTAGGTGIFRSQVKLGSINFAANTPYTIKVWTSLTGNRKDTVNSNDTITKVFRSALRGTYTIGGSSPNFSTFKDAANALNSYGVCGPVVFNVRDGSYTEQITLKYIAGSSTINTITFQSASGDSSKVRLINPSSTATTDNFTLRLDGANYIIFKGISIERSGTNTNGRVIYILGEAANNQFLNNQVIGVLSTASSTARANIFSDVDLDDNNIFRNNYIKYGSYGFYYEGVSTTSFEKGTIIEGNIIDSVYTRGIDIKYQDAPVVRGNYITNILIATSGYGIYASNCNNGQIIRENQVYLGGSGYGIYVTSCDGTASAHGLVANNMVSVGGTSTAYGIYLVSSNYQDIVFNSVLITSTSATAGRAFYGTSVTAGGNINNRLFNNIFANTGGFVAIELNAAATTTNYISASDYNNFYVTGSVLGKWGATNAANLAAWRTASGMDANSISVNPQFTGTRDLHASNIALFGKGTPFSGLTTDIDGDTRKSTPDIGADELTPRFNDAGIAELVNPRIGTCSGTYNLTVRLRNFGLNRLDSVTVTYLLNGVQQSSRKYYPNLTIGNTANITVGTIALSDTIKNIKVYVSAPNGNTDELAANDTLKVSIRSSLNGTYTIGGTNPDFATFGVAVSAINSYGVCGPVTFNVRDGAYTEQIAINEIKGSSASNTVTFRSENGDSTQVILQYSATGTTDNYVVMLNGTDNIRFRNMTIKALGTTYARVLEVSNGATNNQFNNNIFQGAAVTTTSANNYVINSSAGNDDNNTFINNIIKNGSYGMYWAGISASVWEKGTRVINNRFEDQYNYAVRILNQESPQVKGNIVTTSSAITTWYGIYISNAYDSTVITENQVIRTNGGGYGLYLSSVDGFGVPVLVANNYISLAGTGTAYGIYNSASTFINYFHNTVSIYSTSTTGGRTFYLAGNSGLLTIYNNIFANLGGGYTFYTATAQIVAVDSMDYNNVYATGSNIGYWGSAVSNSLAAWQTKTGMDTHSVSVNPLFFSTSSYTPTAIELKNAGLPLASVPFDIEGQPRDPNAPDIGAVELALGNDVRVKSLITPANNSCGNREQAIGVVIENVGRNTQTSVPVAVIINGNPATVLRDTLVSTLEQNDIDTIFIAGGINTSPGGTFNIKVFTALTADDRRTNDTALASFTIRQAPVPGFSFNTPCFGESIQFTDTSKVILLGARYFWDFGDGNTSTDREPEHVFAAPGTYNVKLVLQAPNGCRDSVTTPVTVHPLPVANFSAPSACRGESIRFMDSSSVASGNIVAYSWNFGDGGTSALQNPTHTYTTTGTFNVRLIVTTEGGCMDTVTKQVSLFPAPEANFTAVNSCSGKAVLFTDASTITAATIVSRNWNFGDGNTSADLNPSHLYAAPGTYNVTLVVITNNGCIDSVIKQVTVYPNPVAAFNATTACAGRSVTFTNNSTVSGGTLTYLWNFGDGGTSTDANPVHAYSQAGSYRATLVVITGNNCIDSVSQNITVNPLPNPRWSMQVINGRTVTFIPEDSTLAGYTWQYGDGNFSTRVKPTRTYSADGSYVVTLTVRAASGCEDSFTDTVTISTVGINEVNKAEIGLNIYPNPFSESTTITYDLEKSSRVSVKVFDMAGKEIVTIADKVQASGKQTHVFDAAQYNIQAGIYLLRIMVDDSIINRQIIRLK